MHPANQYALDVAEGKELVGDLTRLAVERYFHDLEREEEDGFPYYHSPEAAQKFIDFCAMCCHFEGRMAGQPFHLLPWQQFIYWNIFGWLRKDNHQRRFSTAYIEVAKKSGKSLMSSVVQLYMLSPIEGEPRAQVYAVATKEDQAKIVFDGAKEILKVSPILRDRYEAMAKSIYCEATNSFFKPLGSDSRTQDGLNVHAASMDEYHEHPDDKMYGNMESAMAARDQPLMFVITTAGFDTESVCYRMRASIEGILKGHLTDDTTFGIIYSMDTEDLKGENWKNKENWKKANPTLGHSVTLEALEKLYTKALNEGGSKVSNFKTKNLNIWLNATEEWEAAMVWHECNFHKITEEDLKGLTCYGGLDLASNNDLTALTLSFPPQGKFKITQKLYYFFMPEDNVYSMASKHRVDYQKWVDLGYIQTTPGNIIDKEYIRHEIRRLNSLFQIENIHYDPWNLKNEAAVWADEDSIEYVELNQGIGYMAPPTKDYETQIYGRLFNHGDNPVMNWMISNCHIYRDINDNIKIHKKKSKGKVDGPVSDVMATFGMQEYKEVKAPPTIDFL